MTQVKIEILYLYCTFVNRMYWFHYNSNRTIANKDIAGSFVGQ